MVKLLIIDGFNLIRRIHSAVPGDENTTEHAQGVVRSIGASVQRALKIQQPTHAVCVLESSGTTWRHAIYSDYKLGRKPQPQPLLDNLGNIKQVLSEQQVNHIAIKQAEADDIIASITHKLKTTQGQCLILSTDHLLAQLLGRKVKQFDHFSNTAIDEAFVKKRYGVNSAQLIDYFTLCGSSSLNIPGVAGVGGKTANKLLKEYGNVENLINQVSDLKGKLKQNIIEAVDLLPLYKRLFSLEFTLTLDTNLKDWRIKN